MKRFVVIAQFGEGAEARAMTASIREAGTSWWHHIESAWLVIDRRDRAHSWWHARLRKRVGKGGRIVIMNVDTGAYSARGPSRMFEWLRSSWSNEAEG